MITRMFSVYDIKAEIFNTPFFMPSRGQAIREFGDLVRDPQSRLSKHPGDYKLVQIGVFDDATGTLLPDERIETVSQGSDFQLAEAVSLAKER